ncbi:MAG TPA: hypothetical protein VF435_08815 [Pyrinomonadaceae bacterium]
MKPRKSILIMLVGLLLVAFAAVMAQTPAQGDQKKKTESCCAMESCCGENASCSMKKEGETTTSADAAEAKDSCCCSGDSCEMKDKADMNHKAGCCGESCDMTKHDANMKHDSKDHKDCCKMKQKKAA